MKSFTLIVFVVIIGFTFVESNQRILGSNGQRNIKVRNKRQVEENPSTSGSKYPKWLQKIIDKTIPERKEKLFNFIKRIGLRFKKAKSGLKKFGKKAIDKIGKGIDKVKKNKKVADVISVIKNKVGKALDALKKNKDIQAAIAGGKDIKSAIKKIIVKGKDLARHKVKDAKDLAGKGLDKVISTGKKIKKEVQKVAEKGEDLVIKGFEKAKNLGEKGLEKAKSLGERGLEKAKELGEKGLEKAKEVGKTGLEKAENIAEKVGDKLEVVAEKGKEKVDEILKTEAGKEVVETVKKGVSAVTDLANKAKSEVEEVLDSKPVQKVKNIATDLGRKIKNFFDGN